MDDDDSEVEVTPEEIERFARQRSNAVKWPLVNSLPITGDPVTSKEDGQYGFYEAYILLKIGSRQDFGYNKTMWAKWIRENPDGFHMPGLILPQRWIWHLYNAELAQNTNIGFTIDAESLKRAHAARRMLMVDSGQDFGFDTMKWSEWYDENRPGEVWDFPKGYQPKKKVVSQ